MSYNVPLYFKRNQIAPKAIIYMMREKRHTILTLQDGRQASTVIPVKEIERHLPENDFLCISKGVVLRKDRIASISDDGVYTMTDGQTFQGRKRSLKQHKLVRLSLEGSEIKQIGRQEPPVYLKEKCSMMDNMQIAFCVIELVFDANGHGVDFIFRYCNKAIEKVKSVPVEAILNHSFYEVFKNGDKKWLVICADVAINGTQRTIRDFTPDAGQPLTIYCFQPASGYCACLLIPSES
ncbi:MAG: hypothetical protein PHU22_06290 [Eubacteriales bacterium]|nr:hypothetical protein [Eubacteriales bacterium]